VVSDVKAPAVGADSLKASVTGWVGLRPRLDYDCVASTSTTQMLQLFVSLQKVVDVVEVVFFRT
jgi:hypothetical protein